MLPPDPPEDDEDIVDATGQDDPDSDARDDNDGGEGDDDEGSEPESEDGAGGPDEADGEQSHVKPTRGEARFQRLSERTRAAEERAERVERQLQDMQSRGRTQEDERAERDRIALMAPDERAAFLVEKNRNHFEREIGGLRFQMADNADHTAFESKCDRIPAFAAVKDEVERILQSERAAGRPGANRETIAKFIIGDRAIKRATGAKTRQGKKNNAERVRQTAKPSNARSDQGRSSGRSQSESDSRKKRLEDINI